MSSNDKKVIKIFISQFATRLYINYAVETAVLKHKTETQFVLTLDFPAVFLNSDHKTVNISRHFPSGSLPACYSMFCIRYDVRELPMNQQDVAM
jgi:hypothetical protein